VNGIEATSRKLAAEEAQPVAAKDGGDVVGSEATIRERRSHLWKIGDRVDAARGRFGTLAAVEVGPDPDMPCVTSDLANGVDRVHERV
jgi:hypothetical protein